MKKIDTLVSELRSIALEGGANKLQPISADIIKTAAWVRLKCKYGCKAYGKHLSCPPYSPTPDETSKVVKDYEHAVLVEFIGLPKKSLVDPKHIHHYLWDLILVIQDVIFKLERHAFLAGYYKAIGFGVYPCSLCESCLPEEGDIDYHTVKRLCRHPDKMRPSMEASGIDVYATVRAAGFDLEVVTSFDKTIRSFGMVLLV
jgi:predicted metal-binding protein